MQEPRITELETQEGIGIGRARPDEARYDRAWRVVPRLLILPPGCAMSCRRIESRGWAVDEDGGRSGRSTPHDTQQYNISRPLVELKRALSGQVRGVFLHVSAQ
jgi:hypothetical protein